MEMQQEMSEAAPKWTDADTDALFSTLGKYWVIFQSIEAQLDKLLLLAWGSDNWAQSQAKLTRMSNAQKIDRVKTTVLTSPDFARVHTRLDWVSHFKSIIEVLHAERESRNALTHSQILFDFADKGVGPPLLSSRIKNDDLFEQHWMSKDFQDKMLMRIGKLAFDMNFVYVQLLHDFQAPKSSYPGKLNP
jgi:hypothetical protein